jgi:hypothetical protein
MGTWRWLHTKSLHVAKNVERSRVPKRACGFYNELMLAGTLCGVQKGPEVGSYSTVSGQALMPIESRPLSRRLTS